MMILGSSFQSFEVITEKALSLMTKELERGERRPEEAEQRRCFSLENVLESEM